MLIRLISVHIDHTLQHSSW